MIKWALGLFVLMLVFTGSLSLYLQANDLTWCDSVPSQNENTKCQKVDAIVSISGGDTNARADKAIELYKNGWADLIVMSGAAADKSGPSNAKAMQLRAIESGINKENILLDEYSHNTTENAENSSKIFLENNIKAVILVTSGYHQRRASLEFNEKAPKVKVVNGPVLTDKNWGVFWWLNPYNWWLALSETVKIGVFYLLRAFG